MPNTLVQRGDWRWWVTVVDYGDPDDSFRWCQQQANPRLESIKVLDGANFYSHCRARNFGAVRSRAEVLCLLDADCVLHPNWLGVIMKLFEQGYDACLPEKVEQDYSGMFAVRKRLFHDVRGYDESFSGWGFDDSDIYSRIAQRGARIGKFDMKLARIIGHDNDMRSCNYEQQNLESTWTKNQIVATDGCRGLVNPAGYGIGRCLHWSAPMSCVPVSG